MFEKHLIQLPIPADYQVPKVLNGIGFIKYSDGLEDIIKKEILIPKGSKYEIQIRAATVLACQNICEVTGWNSSEIDTWFWTKRNEVKFPFHLSITTDY